MKKKGFTLIELLAVIVILAIIALIATPMIMGVIDDARKGAAEASANGYIEAVENSPIITLLQNGTDEGVAANVYDVTDNTLKNIQVKGEKPESGWVAINDEGIVVAASLKFSSYAKHVGYTDTDHAKAILDNAIAKPVKAEEEMSEFLKTAKATVHNALNP